MNEWMRFGYIQLFYMSRNSYAVGVAVKRCQPAQNVIESLKVQWSFFGTKGHIYQEDLGEQ